MSNDVVISVENLSKRYRLGQIGVTSLRESAEHWWHKMRGRDPHVEMGEIGRVSKQLAVGSDGGDVSRRVAEGAEEREASQKVTKEAKGDTQISDFIPQPSSSDYMWALKDVSFEVKRGEVLGIIGKNGAGKSTLLKILSRITEPTSGRAVLHGRVGSLLEVGTGFHPELTGRENVFLNGAILGMKRCEVAAKFDEIVNFAGIDKFVDTPVKRYSSGMYVRLAFSVAAHLESEILLVDEVLAVGDAEFQRKCLGKMESAANGGRAVLFVSHNMGSVVNLCDKCALIGRGKLKRIGRAVDVVREYFDSSATGEASRRWDSLEAPGDNTLRLESVKICQPLNTSRSSIDMTKPFSINIEVDVKESMPELALAVVIWSAEGQRIIQTADLVHSSDVGRSIGKKAIICKLPAYLLNEGHYFASIAADVPFERVIFHEQNAICWSVQNTCPVFSRYGKVHTGGVLAPGIASWQMVEH